MMNSTLPPDPEKMNDDRANRAAIIIQQFRAMTGYCPKHALTWLLCDLMHWADRNGVRFDDALGSARVHYGEETSACIDILAQALNTIAAGKASRARMIEIAGNALQSAPNARGTIDPEDIIF
jgi:hypothetical protein